MFSLINFWTICLLARLSKFEDVRPFHLILTISLVFLDVSWILTAFINPGISVPTHEEGGEYCELCESNNDMEVVKKTGRFHCQECDICIDERHSHYKVVGGCVGRNNLIAFKVLLLAFFLWGLSMVTIVPLVKNF
jgi:hypothetical protein